MENEKENENLKLWNKYKEVPNNAMKPFDNGKFKGTDINTMWRMKCLTEYYGQCGIGWYFVPKRLWNEKYDNGDVFAYAEIELFVRDPQTKEWSMPISGSGGNKIVRMTASGKVSTSDEAYKMAVTDAFGVACKSLGIGATVYWENDKTKYTEYAVLATPEQIDYMRKLGVNEPNVLKRYNISKLEDLSKSDAEFVIKSKEKALGLGE